VRLHSLFYFVMYLFILPLLLTTLLFASDDPYLKRLIEGNKRYASDLLEHPNRTSERREAVAAKQEPFAAILSCSDSRVSPEILFDQGLGDLFIMRVAGNVLGTLELESILYAITYLHCRLILVLGHESCGAVKAVLDNTIQSIPAIAKLIQPSVQKAIKMKAPYTLRTSIQQNALNMRDRLLHTKKLKPLLQKDKLHIYAGYYHLDTGEVEIL